MATLTLTTTPDPCELLVIGIAGGEDGPVVATDTLDEATTSAIGNALNAVGAKGRADEVLRLPGTPYGLPPLMTTGLGAVRGLPDAEALRRAAGAALRAATSGDVAVALPTGGEPTLVEAVGLGALTGAYRFTELKSGEALGGEAEQVRIWVNDVTRLGEAVRRAEVVGEAVRLAKRLVDMPPGQMPPARLATEAVAAVEGTGVAVEVLDPEALAEQGFGGIVAVGRGSANPPRLVRLVHEPDGARAHLALVGKGITFDSGGLSLKPAASMITMKSDMAGAAAVLAAVRAISRLSVPLRITAYLPLAENMPSGSAQRPGDVITAYGGRTVEVLNTDAEGRLVMMDALARCAADAPDAIVDIATLTGAQVVALGRRIAGVMSNDDDWRDQVRAAAEDAGELTWPMPIPEDLRASLDSAVADIANIGERNGGMMTAAAFLREFVPAGVRWAHVDIAGPAFVDTAPWAYNGKGATGFGVRTLIALAEHMAR